MNPQYHIQSLKPSDQKAILKIATWYKTEWDTPIDKTIDRLSGLKDYGLYYQLVVVFNDEIIATGGLAAKVNLLNVYPEFQKFGPWVALLYTEQNYRRQGVGQALLKQIESRACAHDLTKIYLYTFTAESLYKRSGWSVIDNVFYKNHQTVIMEKDLKSLL